MKDPARPEAIKRFKAQYPDATDADIESLVADLIPEHRPTTAVWAQFNGAGKAGRGRDEVPARRT
jgi:hypothetical protein